MYSCMACVILNISERRGSKFDVREDEDDTDLSSIPMGTIEGQVSVNMNALYFYLTTAIIVSSVKAH